MPWALGAGVGEVAAALLLFLLCVAVTYMIKAIAASLAAIPIPIVGRWISGAFTTITNPVVSWLVGASNELWQDAEFWARGIAWLATGLFGDVKSVLNALFGQVDHVVNSVIPGAAAHAQSTANGYTHQEAAAIGRQIATATTKIEGVASADSAQALAKANSHAGTIESHLTRIVAHDLTVAKTYTDHQVSALRRALTGEIGAANPALPGEATAIPSGQPAPISIPLPSEITALPAAVGAISLDLVGVKAAVAAITSEFESCAVTSCAGPNNLANLLKGILGFASLAEIAVFLSDVINDPAGAERKYAGEFSAIAAPFITGGTDIWGALESVLAL